MRRVAGFLAFSHGWTWMFWGAAALIGTSVWAWPASPLFYIGGAGVLLGGVAMTRMTGGRSGLRNLLQRTIDPRMVPRQWWLGVLALYPIVALTAAGLAAAIGGVAGPLDIRGAAARLADPAGLAAMVGFVLVIGPLPEEIGWRGFLQEELQSGRAGGRIRGALPAALVVGLVWWSWHLPLFFLPGYFEAFGRSAPTPVDYLLNIMPAAVLYAWIYNETGHSVLAVIVFHFMENFTSEFLGLAEAVRPYRLVVLTGLAVAVITRAGPRTLSRAGRKRRIEGRSVGGNRASE